MTDERAVLIVGAGPTGMTAAMELSRLGVPVRLVDRLTEFSDTSRALAVQARTMELMEQRGPGAEMQRLGNPGRRVHLHGDGKELAQIELDRADSRFNYITLLAQSETERILREQLTRQGVAVERGTELVALGQGEAKDGAMTAVLRKTDGSLEEAKVPYVIASEGAHSLLRHTLGLAFHGTSLPHSYALADIHVDGPLPEDAMSIFLTQSHLLAAFPLGSKRFRLIATEPDGTEGEGEPTTTYMQQLYDQAAYLPARLYDMVWSSRFRINSRHVDQLRVGNVFLGGDAAHVHSPVGGQGMNTGMQDIINLSWKLAMVYHGVARKELLDTYAQERLPIIRQLVSTTERATDVVSSGKATVYELVEHVAPVLLSFGAVQTLGAGMVSQLAVSYRKSPLNGPERGHGKVKAGDRVPDVPVRVEGKGEEQTLLGLLDPSRFTLLLLAGAEAPLELATSALAAGWLTVRRIAGEALAERFGTKQWALVRPDGYLAMCGKSEETVAVRAWVARWLTARG